MQSGSVNAALLLSSYLGNEHEKIGHGIASSDFAGELGKLLPHKTGTSDIESAEKTDAKNTDAAQSIAAEPDDKSAAADSSKKESIGSVKKKSASQAPEQRLERLKSQTKTGKQVFITNPLMLESILAELQYPAETIKACKSLQNQDGWISLKDLKDLLSNKAMATETLGKGQISMASAQALISSIVQKAESSGTNSGRTFEGLKESIASVVGQGSPGVFNIDEFRALIDQVLQKANNAEARKTTAAAGTSAEGAAASQATEIALQASIAPKQGQTESLASRALPSFVSEKSDETKRGKKQEANAELTSETTSPNVAPETLSLNKTATGVETFAASQSAAAQKSIALDKNQSESETSSSAVSEKSGGNVETDISSEAAQEEPVTKPESPAATSQESGKIVQQGENRQNLTALAEDFGAKIISMSNDKQGTPATEAVAQNDTRSAAAVQGQNIAAQAKEAVKNTYDGISVSDEQARTDVSETAPGTGRIITQQSENTQEQPFPEYNSKRSEGLAGGLREQTKATGATGQFTETIQAANSGIAAKSADMYRESAINDMNASRGTGTSGGNDAGSPPASVLNKAGFPDAGAGGASSGESGSTGQGWQGGETASQASVAQGATTARSVENGISVQSHELAGIAKTVEKQLKLSDPDDAALFQNASSNQGAEIRMEVPISRESSGSALNYNQPGDMAETIENWRAQYRVAGEQQLTLELEPGQFGKVSIRVGAKKDEVSAVVVTESESARQAILRNAPELRQTLDDQGLMLGKFQVDVNGEKAGSGNSGRQKPEAGTKAEKAGRIDTQIRPKPAYIRRASGLSQLSIFA